MPVKVQDDRQHHRKREQEWGHEHWGSRRRYLKTQVCSSFFVISFFYLLTIFLDTCYQSTTTIPSTLPQQTTKGPSDNTTAPLQGFFILWWRLDLFSGGCSAFIPKPSILHQKTGVYTNGTSSQQKRPKRHHIDASWTTGMFFFLISISY
jgi:hypothetical protein